MMSPPPKPPNIDDLLPPSYIIAEAILMKKQIGKKRVTYITDHAMHQKWTDRWLNARWKWWAKYCYKRMDSYVDDRTEWFLV